MTTPKDLAERLRNAALPGTNRNAMDCAAADLIERQAAEIEALRAELDLRRKSGSAIERLHNLCEGIAADADGSEWSREEWERIDAENNKLRADNAMFLRVQSKMQNLIAEQAAEKEALRADAERYREWKRAFREGKCGL